MLEWVRAADEAGVPLLGHTNDAAIRRLIGTLLAEQTDEWHVTRRYLSQESLARVINPDTAQALLAEQQAA